MKLHTNYKIFLVLSLSIISIVGFMLKLPSAFSRYDKVLHASFYLFTAAFLNILFTKGKLFIHGLIFSILYLFGVAIEFAQEYSNHFFHKRIHGRFDPADIKHNLKGLLAFSLIWICYTIISSIFKKDPQRNFFRNTKKLHILDSEIKKQGITIETLSTNNLTHFIELVVEFWQDCSFEEEFENYKSTIGSENEICYLVKDVEKYIAFVLVSIRNDYVEGSDSLPVAYIEGVFVQPAHQKKGIAKKLITMAEEWAKLKGLKQIASDTDINNLSSFNFHKKIGFIEVERKVCFIKKL